MYKDDSGIAGKAILGWPKGLIKFMELWTQWRNESVGGIGRVALTYIHENS